MLSFWDIVRLLRDIRVVVVINLFETFRDIFRHFMSFFFKFLINFLYLEMESGKKGWNSFFFFEINSATDSILFHNQ